LEQFGFQLTKKNSETSRPYDPKNKKQIEFEKAVLNFIIKDSVSLAVVEGVGFKQMIQEADPLLRIPSRRKIGKMLDDKSAKVRIENYFLKMNDLMTNAFVFYRSPRASLIH
jgi:hypothetical protein